MAALRYSRARSGSESWLCPLLRWPAPDTRPGSRVHRQKGLAPSDAELLANSDRQVASAVNKAKRLHAYLRNKINTHRRLIK